MELTLSVYVDEQHQELCVLDVEPSASGREVIEVLVAHLLGPQMQTPFEAWIVRTRARIQEDVQVGEAGLLSGDRVLLSPTGSPPRWGAREPTMLPAPFVVNVVGGPASGETYDLIPGINVLGRSGDCTVLVPDPQVSRRHLTLEVRDGAVVLEDLGSSFGTLVNGHQIVQPVTLLPGHVVTIGSTLFTIEPQALDLRQARLDQRQGLLAFNRPPRVQSGVPEPEVDLPVPPAKPYRRAIPLASSLVPLLMGAGMYFIIGPYALIFAVLSPVMAIASLWEERRGGHKEYKKLAYQFEVDLANVTNALAVTHDEVIHARRSAAPDAVRILDRAKRRRPELWERRPAHTDFLVIRVGTADLPTTIQFGGGENPTADAALIEKVDALRQAHALDHAVPVELDLRGKPVIGMAGDSASAEALARWVVVQTSVLDSPRDVAIVVLCTPETAPRWEWTRWLPHTTTLLTGVPGGRSVAAKREDAVALLKVVDDIVRERQAKRSQQIGVESERLGIDVLLVVAGEVAVSRSSLARILADGPMVGVRAIYVSERLEDLPGECAIVVQTTEHANDTQLTIADSGEVIPNIVVDGISHAAAESAAQGLTALVDVTSSERGGELARRVLLLELLGMTEPSAEMVRGRWSATKPGTLGAPLGMTADGLLELDLRTDGPHGLVAGTTGAGKSELLQSLVAALAAHHPPQQLSFVLVDYKGGAAFKDCVKLPHTVGFFTDLDEHLAQRALISLNAELRRREGILREHGARDLFELEKRARRDPSLTGVPPSLLIVIDEFAFLKNEVPEFVAGVIDIAQRGRSLGVHLLLATQRPTGVIDDNIRANTNLRIALRVADENDSSDVVDRPDAARIPKSLPGRGYIRTGHEEIREVQVAFGGAASSGAATQGEVRVMTLEFASGLLGRRMTIRASSGTPSTDMGKTDLQRLVSAIVDADRGSRRVELTKPWLPPLSELYSLGELPAPELPRGSSELVAVVGMIDEPDQQRQRPWMIDLANAGHLLIYGAAGTGKTTALRTIAVSLASRLWPTDLHIYGLDMASRGLRALTDMPQCGGVVSADEPERIERLLSMLEGMIVDRSARIGRVGASSLMEYRAAGHRDLPYVVLLIDGYHGFHSMFEAIDNGAAIERLGRIAADCRSLGILLVVTVDRRSGLPSSLVGVASQRIIFRMASDDEYAWLGVAAEAKGVKLAPGRAFAEGTREVQLAIVGHDPSGAGQANAIAEYAAHLASYGVEAHVPPIALLPEHVSRSVFSTFPGNGLSSVPLGLGGGAHGVVAVDLLDNPIFMVTGPDRSGRSTALATMAIEVMARQPGIEAFLLAPRRSRLVDLPGWTEVAQGIDACDELAERLSDEVRARAGMTEYQPMLVVIDDGDELAEGRSSIAIETIVRRGRDAGVIFLVASLTHALHRLFGGWLTDARKGKHGLLLMPDLDVDGELFGVRLPRSATRTFPVGRGFLIQRGPAEVVHVAQ